MYASRNKFVDEEMIWLWDTEPQWSSIGHAERYGGAKLVAKWSAEDYTQRFPDAVHVQPGECICVSLDLQRDTCGGESGRKGVSDD